jgi:hypothetical protein
MSTAFWKPGTIGPGSTVDRASEIEGGAMISSAPIGIGQLSVQAQRERLPIFKHRTSRHLENILRRVDFFSQLQFGAQNNNISIVLMTFHRR